MRTLNTPRIWIGGAGLVGLLLVAATWLLVIAPARSDAASIRSKVDDATLVQTTLRHRLADLETASKDLAGLRADAAAATAAVPATADTQGLLRQLQVVATTHRVAVGSIAISPPEETSVPGVSGLPVSVTLSGAPDDLVTVVQQLQSNAGRALSIKANTLDVVAPSAASLALDLTMYSTSALLATGGTGAAGTATGGAAAPGGAASGGAAGGTAAAPATGPTTSAS